MSVFVLSYCVTSKKNRTTRLVPIYKFKVKHNDEDLSRN
jgi:hypothetical protein